MSTRKKEQENRFDEDLRRKSDREMETGKDELNIYWRRMLYELNFENRRHKQKSQIGLILAS